MTALADSPVQAWPTLRYNVLGPLRIDGVTKDGRLEKKVAALLLLRPGRSVPMNVFYEELWGVTPPKGAQQSVQTYVYRIRNLIPTVKDSIHCHGGAYTLDAHPLEVDSWRFSALLSTAEVYAARQDWAATLDAVTAAFSLWVDEPLANVDCGPILTAYTVDMKDRYRTAQELALDAKLGLGLHREILDELSSLLRADPGREDTAGKLMLALYRSRRAVEALSVFDRTRRYLVDEHGMDPCADLRRLQQQILRRDLGLELNGAA